MRMKIILATSAMLLMLVGVGVGASVGAAGNDPTLVEAVKKGNSAAVRALIQKGVDVNASEVDGTTALHWAAQTDSLETVELLIRAGAKVGAANRYGVQPLSIAAISGNTAIIEALLKAGADPNTTQSEGETALMTAARTGNPAAVKMLVAHDAIVNTKENWRGQTALMWAASEGHLDTVKVLLESGAEVNAQSTVGYTPLMFAVRSGQMDVVRTLLDAGANVNAAIKKGGIGPLAMAITNVKFDIASLLIEKGANPNADAPGYAPLHLMAMSRNPGTPSVPNPIPRGDSTEVLKQLIAHGANVDARLKRPFHGGGSNAKGDKGAPLNEIGATPFLLAAEMADIPMMRLLLANGADPNLKTADNQNALMAAAGLGYAQGNSPGTEEQALEAIKICIELGNDVSLVDNGGYTAVHGAAIRGANSIVQFLYDKGVRLDVRSREKGQLPLTIAENGDPPNSNIQARPETAALLRKLMAASTSAKVD
jgi:ankyrin repeat protein